MKVFPYRLHAWTYLAALLFLGFVTTSMVSYWVSHKEVQQSLVHEALPLTSDNIYNEIQKDMLRPVLLASHMAHDAFVRDWLLSGEQNRSEMIHYLTEAKENNGLFTSFLVSDQTHHYYHAGGMLKNVSASESRDRWYFRLRAMNEPFSIETEADIPDRERVTFFVNHRIVDEQNRFLGAIGLGIKLDTLTALLTRYEQRFGRRIYFVNTAGEVMLTAQDNPMHGSLQQASGVKTVAAQILAQQTNPSALSYRLDGQKIELHARFIPELGWYLLVEQNASEALRPFQQVLLLNLLICGAITLIIAVLARYRIQPTSSGQPQLAFVNPITSLPSRPALDVLLSQKLSELNRNPRPISGLLIDIDWFADLQQQCAQGKMAEVLQELADLLRAASRASDIVAHIGRSEFMMVLDDCELLHATELAERLRHTVEQHRFAVALPAALTISVAVAQWQRGDAIEIWLLRLDDLLEQAQSTGRNQVVSDDGADVILV
ncbi:diguanylate cyclase [Chitinibacter sp. SCUT-21]|uniref:sensor domain-containing diguanylate cyclase n=1 Tax=Chitinibacter sp. SCUT-21 TaxID=2970891 RepID=UPI0035A726A7